MIELLVGGAVMHRARHALRTTGTPVASRLGMNTDAVSHFEVKLTAGVVSLDGTLSLPATSSGLVIFAHGSGSNRHSPRNRFVADVLNEERLGTLLLDLLTPREALKDASSAELRFDLPLLTDRLVAAVDWAQRQQSLSHAKVGLFGASTGAAVALLGAARRPTRVRAIVSRGGRPDLVGADLRDVQAPTLLLVGSLDEAVLALNRRAALRLPRCALEEVPGAGHLFEEPGAMSRVAELTSHWFRRELNGEHRVAPSAR